MFISKFSSRLSIIFPLFACLVLAFTVSGCGSAGDGSPAQESSALQVSHLPTLGSPSPPVMIYNDQGNGLALWEVHTRIARWLYYALYERSTDSWSASEPLTSVANPTRGLYPQVASNGEGFALVWRETTETRDELYAHLLDVDGWSTTERISGGEVDLGTAFELTSNGTGYAVTWVEDDGSDDRVYALVSPDGRSWDDAELMDVASSAGLPRLASNGFSYAFIWTAHRLKARLYVAAAWGPVEVVDEDGYESIHGHHRIASNGTGYSVIWSSWNGSQASLWNRTRSGDSLSDWSDASLLYTGKEPVYHTKFLSNGTGYAVSYSHSDGFSAELHAVVDALGDRQWGLSQLLEPVLPNFVYWRMATDNSGYAIAWERHEGISTHETLASVYGGNQWSEATLINTLVYPDSLPPVYLVGFDGLYAIAWRDEASIYARVYTIAGWSDAELIEDGLGEAQAPFIAVNPLDGIRVAWNQLDADGDRIVSHTNALDGNQWSGEVRLTEANYFVGSSYYPRLLVNGHGNTLAVWTQDRNGKNALYANLHQEGGWGNPKLLEDSNTYVHPQIATDGTGFAVLWQANDDSSFLTTDSTFSTFVVVYDGLEWGTVEPLGESELYGFSIITAASIASKGEEYLVVYRRSDDSTKTEQILARYYDGSVWQPPVQLDESLVDPFGFIQTVSNDDTYLSIWSHYDGDRIKIYSSVYAGTSWSKPQLLLSDDYTWDMAIPRLASNGEDYLLVWLQGESVIARIHAGNWSAPMQIGDAVLNAWYQPDIPSVQSNGIGYAVAWTAYDDVRTLIKVNVFDGHDWLGVADIFADEVSFLSFDPFGDNDKLTSSGVGYSLIWGAYDGATTDIRDIYASVYDGMTWSRPRSLDSRQGRIANFQVTGDGEEFLAAWLQENDQGNYDVIAKRTTEGIWGEEEVLDVGIQSAYDLNLLGDWDGHRLIWTQAATDDDASIRYPWARLRF